MHSEDLKPVIGLALGSGSARGWSHIGVIQELEAMGVRAEVVAGTSIGALVGAVYVSGQLNEFADWVRKLGVRDVLEARLLPPLLRALAVEAPGVDIAAVRADRRELEAELARGTLDAAIDIALPLSPAVRRQRLVADALCVVARAGHPQADAALDLDTYLRLDHVLTSSRRSGPAPEDAELSRHGLQRRVRLRCQHYFSACRVVSQTDLVLTMPESYARIASAQWACQLLPFPLPTPTLDAVLYWHAQLDADPANAWLRERLLRALDG